MNESPPSEHGVMVAVPRETLRPALMLTDLADDLRTQVLSYFHFFERSKLRIICRWFKSLVDVMPGATALEIRLVRNEAHQKPRGRPWTVALDRSKSMVKLELNQSDEGIVWGAPCVLKDLPRSLTIRPARLHIESATEDVGFDERLLRHLAVDVGETVTDLSVVGLGVRDIGLQESVAKFDEFGPPVTKLHLSTKFSLVLAISAATRLRRLESFRLTLRSEMMPELKMATMADIMPVGLHLSALSYLSNLQDLKIDMHHDSAGAIDWHNGTVRISFMLGCSSIPHLRRLSSEILFNPWHDDESSKELSAISAMISRLPDLEGLSLLNNPSKTFWDKVHALGGHVKLRKLAVYYIVSDPEDLESLTRACIQDFPQLKVLELHFWKPPDNEISRALVVLKSHPSLRSLNCGWKQRKTGGNFIPECQESLGNDINVNEIPFYEYK